MVAWSFEHSTTLAPTMCSLPSKRKTSDRQPCRKLPSMKRRASAPVPHMLSTVRGAVSDHGVHLSLSRLNHLLPRGQTNPKVMQRTADFHPPIADALLPQPKPVFDNATALDTAIDMLNPETALIQ